MLLTTNNRIKTKNKAKLAILKELTHNSKDLYNKALYTIRQYFFLTKECLPYSEVYRLLKSSEEYKRLPTNFSALNILRKSVACDSLIQEIAGRGLVFQPVRVRIHPYKSSRKRSPVHITK